MGLKGMSSRYLGAAGLLAVLSCGGQQQEPPQAAETQDGNPDPEQLAAAGLSTSTTPPSETAGKWAAPQKLIRRATTNDPGYGTITWTFGQALCRDMYHNVHMLYYDTHLDTLYYRSKAPAGTETFRAAAAIPKGTLWTIKFGSIACTDETGDDITGSVGLTAVWVEKAPDDEGDKVYLSRSADLGVTWSTPATLVYDSGAQGTLDHLTLHAYWNSKPSVLKTEVLIGFLEETSVEEHWEYKVIRRTGSAWNAASFSSPSSALNAAFEHSDGVDADGKALPNHTEPNANTPTLSSNGGGTLYAVWDTKNDTVSVKGVFYAKSNDFGASWTSQAEVTAPGAGTPGNDPTSAVAEDGTLYVVSQGATDLTLYRSEDGGATFSKVTDDLVDDSSTGPTTDTDGEEHGTFGAIAALGTDIAIAWEGYCRPGADCDLKIDAGKYVGLAFADTLDTGGLPLFTTPNFMFAGNAFDAAKVYASYSPMGDAMLSPYYLDVVWVTGDDRDAPTTGEVYHRQYRIR